MSETVIVRVTQGNLRGRKTITKYGIPYYSFQGIPYAKPPVGSLRFKTPQPPDPWEGVRNALKEGSVCPQLDVLQKGVYKGDEDSLFLNVYTRELLSAEVECKKAVMVWFHGGGFGFGSGNTDLHGPDHLMEGDVVLVTINYRLGPLGFLSLPDAGVPGNNGLKDQVMALHWVRQNISQFGGDSDNVTIFGTSAGSASVQYHLLSPMSKGLFHRAIAQSGSALNPWAYDDPITAREKAFQLGEVLGLKTTDANALLQFLQNLSAKEITEGLYNSLTDEDKILLTIFSVPTCDKGDGSDDVFLPDSPYSLITEGKFHDVPYITGMTSNEGMLMLKEIMQKPHLLTTVENKFELVLPKNLDLKKNSDTFKKIIEKVKHFYFGSKTISQETISNYTELNSDVQFVNGINSTVKYHLQFSKSPVYYYCFAFDGALGLLKKLIGVESFSGVCHGDDTAYIFNAGVLDIKMALSSPEMRVVQCLVKLWTNFARTGNPTPTADPVLGIIVWRPATKSDMSYFSIDKDLSMRNDLRLENIKFWEEIYNTVSWKKN